MSYHDTYGCQKSYMTAAGNSRLMGRKDFTPAPQKSRHEMDFANRTFFVTSFDIPFGKNQWYWSSNTTLVFPSDVKGYFSLSTRTLLVTYSETEPKRSVGPDTERVTDQFIYNEQCWNSKFNPEHYTMIVGADFIDIGEDIVTIYSMIYC